MNSVNKYSPVRVEETGKISCSLQRLDLQSLYATASPLDGQHKASLAETQEASKVKEIFFDVQGEFALALKSLRLQQAN